MSVRDLVGRTCAVSATALGLSLSVAGVAHAGSTSPLPPVPAPGDVVGTVTQTVTTAVDTLTAVPSSLPASVPTTAPSTPPTTAPLSPTTANPATAPAPKAAPKPTVHRRSVAIAAARPQTAHHAANASAQTRTSLAAAPFAMPVLGLPDTTTAALPAGQAPAVAAANAPQTTTRIQPAAATTDGPESHSSTLRLILVILATWAAAALAFEHLRQLRTSFAG
jgi:hypothetical protein